jgi:pimeloyl-ACP methyl ester carboxylesterase
MPTLRFVQSLSAHGFHRVAYREWGAEDNPHVLFCVHGLTRNGLDFETLAERLSDRWRVLSPDLPGRGDSEWLANPLDYMYPTYLTAITVVLAHAQAQRIAWLGTSLGGLLGMVVAAQPNTPVDKLIVNDVGTIIEPAALARISSYVGRDPDFASMAELEAHIRAVSAPFGPLTDGQWRALSESSARRTTDGRFRLKYDPGIAVPFKQSTPQSGDLWPVWDAIRCPTLLIRGEESDLLSRDTASQMRARGPKPRQIDVPGVGHAPMLMTDEQIEPIADFLQAAA